MNKTILNFFLLIHVIICTGFLNMFPINLNTKPKNINCLPINNNCDCREQIIYRQYLIGLRKSRRLLNTTSNVNTLLSIANFTNQFITNYATINNSTAFNNTEVGVKNIMMGNMILDVSNVKYIKISTKKDTIIVELDKQIHNTDNNILDKINNLETIINTISLLGKIVNIN